MIEALGAGGNSRRPRAFRRVRRTFVREMRQRTKWVGTTPVLWATRRALCDASSPQEAPSLHTPRPLPRPSPHRRKSCAKVDEERVAAAFADVRSAVKDVLGVDVDESFRPRIVAAKDIATRVAEENLPMVRLRQPDEELAQREADGYGRVFGQSALAKYTWTTKELLVSAKTWRRQATKMKRPALTSDEALRAVLVHEIVHALDDARYDIGKVMAGLRTVDAIQGFNGVVEGHAQLLARRVCEKRGWASGFDVFTANIGGVPEGCKSLRRGPARHLAAQGAMLASPYVAGESFMAAVEASGAESVVRVPRTARQPGSPVPTGLVVGPAKRPKSKFASPAALDLCESWFPAETWASGRMTLPRAGLEASMTRLGAELTKKALDGRVTSTSITLQPRADPNSKLVMLALHEFVDERSALDFFAAGTELGKARDEDMRRRMPRCGSWNLTSESIGDEGWTATVERRKLKNLGLEFVATSVRIARREMVVEMVFSNEPVETAEVKKRVAAVIAALNPK
ncbi:MAG: hypothetical protein IPJ19_18760 [Planctomycetes bacterium]|nr:hypothetical protein [Planctomycetota bacterium]